MPYSGFEPEPTRLQAGGHISHTGWVAWRLLLAYIDTTAAHFTSLSMIQRIGERTILYLWRACEQLRHFESEGLWVASFVCDGLFAFAVDRWRHDCCAKVACLFVSQGPQ
ncbi:hypothetical protein TNCV_3276951 [Trichonephila clavipes]|nr:hypothetical protein TNCV_3276951 [Trichonephila clavipes]